MQILIILLLMILPIGVQNAHCFQEEMIQNFRSGYTWSSSAQAGWEIFQENIRLKEDYMPLVRSGEMPKDACFVLGKLLLTKKINKKRRKDLSDVFKRNQKESAIELFVYAAAQDELQSKTILDALDLYSSGLQPSLRFSERDLSLSTPTPSESKLLLTLSLNTYPYFFKSRKKLSAIYTEILNDPLTPESVRAYARLLLGLKKKEIFERTLEKKESVTRPDSIFAWTPSDFESHANLRKFFSSLPLHLGERSENESLSGETFEGEEAHSAFDELEAERLVERVVSDNS